MSTNSFLEVQAILDKRVNGQDKVEFLIQWRGLDDSFNSWEPLKNLSLLKELIVEYENAKLKTNPDYIIEDELKHFITDNSLNTPISAQSSDYLPQSTDKPLRIISLSKYGEEVYALIEWQVRSYTGIKPKNSYISTSKLKKDKSQAYLYLNYLERKILITDPY